MAVKWEDLKSPAEQMFSSLERAKNSADEFSGLVDTAIARGGKDKDAWNNAKREVGTLVTKLTEAHTAAKSFKSTTQTAATANGQGQPVAGNAESEAGAQWKIASDAADEANGLVDKAKKSLANVTLEEEEQDTLDDIGVNLEAVITKGTGHRDKAKAALDISGSGPAPAPVPKPPAPGGSVSAADKARKAVADARTALGEAETASKKITDAGAGAKLDELKRAVKDVAGKVKTAQSVVGAALDEVSNAHAANGADKADWEAAKKELTDLTKPNGKIEEAISKAQKAATAVDSATDIGGVKNTWKDSAGLLTGIKVALESDKLKKVAPLPSAKPVVPDQNAAAGKAKKSIADARNAFGEAETASKKITDAGDDAKLAELHRAAKDAAAKVAAAKVFLETAKTEATQAEAAANGQEKTSWGKAKDELTDLTKAQSPLLKAVTATQTGADAVATASTVAAAKTAWKPSADALKEATTKLEAAAELKTLVPPVVPALLPTDPVQKKPSAGTNTSKKAAGAFGVSITAEYSKKFSLETKMHSQIEVTMVPYPAPPQFIEWVKDHFAREQRTANQTE